MYIERPVTVVYGGRGQALRHADHKMTHKAYSMRNKCVREKERAEEDDSV